MNVKSELYEIIGKTPLYSLEKTAKKDGVKATVTAKLEFLNPGGSIKDRAALYMLEDAKKRGLVGDGTVIIEPTSGNTGIGLAMLCAAEGRRLILTMPDSMSAERRQIFAAYGAELVLTQGTLGMKGCVAEAERIAKEIPDSFIPSQFENPANARAHYETTGPEIFADTDGKIDVFVATAGTGGTVSGTARYLKEMNPEIKVVAVEPASSPLITKGEAGAHKIQGIGANFIPEVLDLSLVDEIVTVTDEDAYEYCKRLAREEGLLVGISSGAAVSAAIKIAKRPENEGKNIVTLLPDTGMRYLSQPGLFN